MRKRNSAPGPESQKENLVLVNSFYTNRLLLGGLIDYLEDRFRVHFIDLPGFSLDAPPRPEVSLESFSTYVAEKIDELGLDRYILAGISFGYTVISRLPPDERCGGVVAIFPFLGKQSLNLKRRKRMFYVLVVGFFDVFRLSARVWRTRLLRKFAFWYSTYPADRVQVILDHMDGRTFFAAGRLILSRKHDLRFQDRPHVLILNPEDRTIRYDYALRAFRENVPDLFLLHTDLEHYPVNPCKEYFAERFREEDMDRIVDFLSPAGKDGAAAVGGPA